MNCWASSLTFHSWLGEVFNNPISQPTQEEQADVIGKSNARTVYRSYSTVYSSSKHSPGTVCKAWFSSASIINIDQATVKKTSKGAKALFYIDIRIMILEKAQRWSHPILLPAPMTAPYIFPRVGAALQLTNALAMTGLWKASALWSQPHHKSHGPSKASSKIKVLPCAAFMCIFLIKITRGLRSAKDQWNWSLRRGTLTYLPLLIKHHICWKCALPSLKKITTTTLCNCLFPSLSHSQWSLGAGSF